MKVCILFKNGKEKAVTLSYDDGVDSDERFIGLMERYGMKCTFNINSGLYSPEGSERQEGQIHFRLPQSRVKELYDNPLCEVATHGFSHPFFKNQPAAQCMIEIIKDRQNLEKLFGRIIRGHAYPYGDYNDNVVDILKQAGIVYARTVHSHHSFKIPTDWLRMGATCHHNDEMLPELTERFVNGKVGNNDGWLFYLWGHTYEFRGDDNWEVIENFFEKVSGNENIWYATNMEVYEYVEAYRNLVFSADGNMVFNPSVIDVWAKIDGKNIHIPAGETLKL